MLQQTRRVPSCLLKRYQYQRNSCSSQRPSWRHQATLSEANTWTLHLPLKRKITMILGQQPIFMSLSGPGKLRATEQQLMPFRQACGAFWSPRHGTWALRTSLGDPRRLNRLRGRGRGLGHLHRRLATFGRTVDIQQLAAGISKQLVEPTLSQS